MYANVYFNRTKYALPTGDHKGSNLRAFFAVPKDKDLWIESEAGDDILVEPKAAYFIEDGDKLYATSQKINQG